MIYTGYNETPVNRKDTPMNPALIPAAAAYAGGHLAGIALVTTVTKAVQPKRSPQSQMSVLDFYEANKDMFRRLHQ